MFTHMNLWGTKSLCMWNVSGTSGQGGWVCDEYVSYFYAMVTRLPAQLEGGRTCWGFPFQDFPFVTVRDTAEELSSWISGNLWQRLCPLRLSRKQNEAESGCQIQP